MTELEEIKSIEEECPKCGFSDTLCVWCNKCFSCEDCFCDDE